MRRRQLLRYGALSAVAIVAAGVTGYELIEHGVLPGKLAIDEMTGACSVSMDPLKFGPLGPTRSGQFYSSARRTTVGYRVAWPAGHGPGALLPLVVFLHGFGGSHDHTVTGMSLAQLVALRTRAVPRTPFAVVTVDGGGGYWHPHPTDDPMAMVVRELIPMCQAMGLGRKAQGIGIMGISMGGYGAIVMAEHHPNLFRAVAAIGPAVWTTYDEAHGANAGAFSDRAEFAAYDAVTHTSSLRSVGIRVASGNADPFHDGVVALVRQLPSRAVVVFGNGCHTAPFFTAQEAPSMDFLASHLSP